MGSVISCVSADGVARASPEPSVLAVPLDERVAAVRALVLAIDFGDRTLHCFKQMLIYLEVDLAVSESAVRTFVRHVKTARERAQ